MSSVLNSAITDSEADYEKTNVKSTGRHRRRDALRRSNAHSGVPLRLGLRCMSSFKVGDQVWVPHAVYMAWEPSLTKVKRIEIDPYGNPHYVVDLLFQRSALREELHPEECKFLENRVFADYPSCEKFVKEYYYDGLCHGCHYEDQCGHIWMCQQCEYAKWTHDKYGHKAAQVCARNEIQVSTDTIRNGQECCRYFKPILPQDKEAYQSWEHYEDVLRNCEFNQKCEHHKNSAHKTCSYEYWLSMLLRIPCSFEYKDRKVKAVIVPRNLWIDQTFKNGDNVQCHGLIFEPILTKKGLKKKGIENYESFECLKTVNISTGEIQAPGEITKDKSQV